MSRSSRALTVVASALGAVGCGALFGVDFSVNDGAIPDAAGPPMVAASDAASGAVEVDASCLPANAEDCRGKCGVVRGRCGALLECARCVAGEICGGGGPNTCGRTACEPSCAGQRCGASDGCSGLCPEGSCGPGLRCAQNTCVCDASSCAGCCSGGGECMPGTTEGACGTGGSACRACAAPTTCGGGGPRGVCGCVPSCTGQVCGAPDGCGGTCATNSCGAAQSCVAGVCRCADTSKRVCAGACVSANDPEHCGVCGHVCPEAARSCTYDRCRGEVSSRDVPAVTPTTCEAICTGAGLTCVLGDGSPARVGSVWYGRHTGCDDSGLVPTCTAAIPQDSAVVGRPRCGRQPLDLVICSCAERR